MVKVGVFEDQGKTATIDILAQLCKCSGMKVSIIKEANFNLGIHNDHFSFANYINELNHNNIDMVILRLTEEGVSKHWFSNIDFDIMIYNIIKNEEEYATLYFDDKKQFLTLSVDTISIINSDDRRIFRFLKGSKTRLITYGFNSKASITASSVQQEEFDKRVQCCVQRTLTTFSGKKLEPQEFSITLPLSKDQEVYNALAAITAAIINDIDVSEKKYF